MTTARDSTRNEANFLGCLLRSPHEYWQINDVVAPDMFTATHHKELYGAIRDIAEGGRTVSTSALTAHLPEEYDDAGPTIAIIETLKANAIEAGSATDYAPFIAEQAARARLDKLAEWLKKETKSQASSVEDVAASAAVQLNEIMATAAPIRPVKLSDATARVIDFSLRTIETGKIPGFDTGLTGLDDMMGMLMGGDFVAVIGALGEGKSALLTQIGKHIARRAPVLNAQNEMSLEQNATRAVAAGAGMSVRQIREGGFDFQGKAQIDAAQIEIEKLQYHLYVNPKMTVRSIKARAMQMQRTIGLGAILIDGFKRLRSEVKHRDKWDRYEELTGSIKELAIELNVPILLAVQRTRTARRREDQTPHLDDADAPTIETDADTVLGVWREESWLMMNRPNGKSAEQMEEWEHKIRHAKGIGKIIALKVRSGRPFEAREFKWDGPATMFRDL